MKLTKEINQILDVRFGHDTLLSVATVVTVDGSKPFVRIVDSYYEGGSFYVVTYTLSNKMKQIGENPNVAVCGEWFTASGVGENLGWVRDEKNTDIMAKLRTVFDSWYSNGHVNEEDENTCILRIKLTNGVLFSEGTRYDIEFEG